MTYYRKPKLEHPRCSVCIYIHKYPEFGKQIQESTYFSLEGKETMMDVNHRWGDPFSANVMYLHMRRHMSREMEAKKLAFKKNLPMDILKEAIGGEVIIEGAAEKGLDEIINKGRLMLSEGTLTINATTLLKAIQLKHDHEKATKDRGLEAFKMMAGAFKGNNGPEDTSGA